MAKAHITATKFHSVKGDSTSNAGGKIYVFEPGGTFSTPKTTYSDNALTTANAHPVVCDSNGDASIFFDGNADIQEKTSTDVLIRQQLNVNSGLAATATLLTGNTTITSGYNTNTILASGTITLTLDTALSLGAGFYVRIKNIGSGTVTIARTSGGDTIDRVAANVTMAPEVGALFQVNGAANGFERMAFSGTSFFYSLLDDATAAAVFTTLGIENPVIMNRVFN